MARAAVWLHVATVLLNVREALGQGLPDRGGVGVLVLHLPAASLLHHVRGWAQVAGWQILVAHDLGQSGSTDTVQGTHHVVCYWRPLREASLLAHTWVHPS